MKHFLRPFLLLLVSTSMLAGCKKETGPSTGLTGTWKLTNRECFCVPVPLADETLTFTDTEFSFYKENRQTVYGNYSFAPGKICGVSTPTPLLYLAYVNATSVPGGVVVTVTGNTLVLDYGIACDAPRETYKRLNLQ